jgi:hypothetical protein
MIAWSAADDWLAGQHSGKLCRGGANSFGPEKAGCPVRRSDANN